LIIFTSPPFFDFEIYTEKAGQSVKDLPVFEDWVVGFLFTSLEKAWERLEVGGHMALHITDVWKTRVCEPMNLFIQMHLPGSHYCGIIASSGKADKPRPIWVWRKKDEQEGEDEHRKTLAREDLKQIFPKIYGTFMAKQSSNGKKRRTNNDEGDDYDGGDDHSGSSAASKRSKVENDQEH